LDSTNTAELPKSNFDQHLADIYKAQEHERSGTAYFDNTGIREQIKANAFNVIEEDNESQG
jgi:hypothetical protein